jgi:hypothetical protein
MLFGGGELKRQVAELAAQVAQLKGRLEAKLAAPPPAPAPAPAPVVVPAAAAGPTLQDLVAVAEFHTRELSAMAAEVLQLGYGYDLDTVQMTWNRFAAGDRQAFFSALTGPGGEGLAVHLGNAAEDPDYGEDFQKALDRLVISGKRFLELLARLDGQRVVIDSFQNGPLGEFLGAVRNPAAAGDSPAAA